jgi:rhodanese-related sulfurtransferase
MNTGLARYLIAFLLLAGSRVVAAPAADFMSPGLSAMELQEKLATPAAPLVVDVRKPVEFGIAHIPGAKNIPLDEIEQRLDEFRSENGVLVYCINGARTRQAEPLLYNHGIENVFHLEGALQGWIRDKYPIEKGGVKKTGW